MDLTLFIVMIILIGSIYYLFTLITDLKMNIKQMTNTCMSSNVISNGSNVSSNVSSSGSNVSSNGSNVSSNGSSNGSSNVSSNVKPIIEFLIKMKELF